MANFTILTNQGTTLEIQSPFGTAVIATQIKGMEGLSTPFDFEVELASLNRALPFENILGQAVTLQFVTAGQRRIINGVVSEFYQGATLYAGQLNERTLYKARVVPLLWVATLTHNCRIFQNQDYLSIVTDILDAYRISYRNDVQNADTTPRDITIQFNETDLTFIQRLLEYLGVYYYFTHTDNGHVMHLANTPASAEAIARDPFPFVTHTTEAPYLFGIQSCEVRQHLVSSAVAVKDYNFETPTTNLLAETQGDGLGGAKYFYPGRYGDFTQQTGEALSRIWLEGEETGRLMVLGTSTIPFMLPGLSFQMKNYPREALNGTPFVVSRVYHESRLQKDILDLTQESKREALYSNRFEGFGQTEPWRPPRLTPWPKLTTQTAVVTGKEGEEIWTDQYGRVRVKFFWDRSDAAYENTSCWIRVAQFWTGNTWGALFIPRVGQEVVVQFIDGDPDRPVITGCVYNQANMPPYLPDQPTVSTIKTNSSKGGDGFNELRFDDKKGSEQIFIHAQKDMETVVEHDQTLTVVKGDRTSTLQDGDYTVLLQKGNRSITVEGGNEMHTNKQNFTHAVTQNYTLEVDGNYQCTVKGNATTQVQGNCTLTVMGNLQIQVTGEVQVQATSGMMLESQATAVIQAGAAATINANATLILKGGATCAITAPIVAING